MEIRTPLKDYKNLINMVFMEILWRYAQRGSDLGPCTNSSTLLHKFLHPAGPNLHKFLHAARRNLMI